MAAGDYPHYKDIELSSVYLDDIEHILTLLSKCSDNVFIEVVFRNNIQAFNDINELKRYTGMPIKAVALAAYLSRDNQYIPRKLMTSLANRSVGVLISIPNDPQLLGLQSMIINFLKRRRRISYQTYLSLMSIAGGMALGEMILYLTNGPHVSLFDAIVLTFGFMALPFRLLTIYEKRGAFIRWEYSTLHSSWWVRNKDALITGIFGALIVSAVTYMLTFLNLSQLLFQFFK